MISSPLKRKNLRRMLLGGLFFYILFLINDLREDLHRGSGIFHIVSELVVAAGTIGLCVFLFDHLFKIKIQSEVLESQMKQLEEEYQSWKKRTSGYIQALTEEIDEQLTTWELSPAEKEIALLLLKGFTNKEIAKTRNTSEHTIKQQASAVYRKSGLKTRAEISAFFLGDLLPRRLESLPQGEAGPETQA